MKRLMALWLAVCCMGGMALAEGFPEQLDMSGLAEPAALETAFTPGCESCGKAACYWETPMDPMDEEAVWAMLTAPITVLEGDTRLQVKLRAAPDEDSAAIGEITRGSQGVHVLAHLENGWSRVECYSSSFEGSPTRAWNALLTGYVKTSMLKEVQVKQKYGFVVDKLDQRLYIYQEGKLLDVLAVSTGYGTEEKGYNESRSGEFLLYSLSGAFPSENLTCNYGIRYNAGDLLHEVPHIKQERGDNYGYTEPYLGQRASHGCIRVQRKRTEKGINMRWIWNALYDGQVNSRMVIWEDWQGRRIPEPAVDTPLYYNPQGGENYHDSPTCYGVKDRYEPMTAFTWGELEMAPYDELDACPYCVPPRRAREIAQINAEHMPE